MAVPAVPAGAVAVAYNLTAVNPATGGHLRMQPGDAPGVTPTSVVNFRPGQNISNAAIVKLSPTRTVKVYAAASTHVLVDIVGYFAAGAGSRFTAIAPVRVYDTALDPAGSVPPATRRLVSPRTAADGVTPVVPAGAMAVAYNLTVTDTAGAGHLRVMPAGAALTATSAVNWAIAGERIANASAVGLDAAGRFEVYNGSGAPVRFLVDVVGYYSDAGTQFYPIDPVRSLVSRTSEYGPVGAGVPGIRNATAADVAGFVVAPVGSPAVAYNATVTNTGSAGHLRLFPAGTALPNASVLNWPTGGYTRANASVTQVSVARTVSLYNGSSTNLDAILDVNGYYR